jgi:hypothetical protein
MIDEIWTPDVDFPRLSPQTPASKQTKDDSLASFRNLMLAMSVSIFLAAAGTHMPLESQENKLHLTRFQSADLYHTDQHILSIGKHGQPLSLWGNASPPWSSTATVA